MILEERPRLVDQVGIVGIGEGGGAGEVVNYPAFRAMTAAPSRVPWFAVNNASTSARLEVSGNSRKKARQSQLDRGRFVGGSDRVGFHVPPAQVVPRIIVRLLDFGDLRRERRPLFLDHGELRANRRVGRAGGNAVARRSLPATRPAFPVPGGRVQAGNRASWDAR